MQNAHFAFHYTNHWAIRADLPDGWLLLHNITYVFGKQTIKQHLYIQQYIYKYKYYKIYKNSFYLALNVLG